VVSQTNEQALETAIERKLTGTCLEDLKSGEFKTAVPDTAEVAETCTPFDTHHGYEIGYPQHFNPEFAVDEKKFWAFLENTQEKELEKLKRKRPGSDEWQRKILERLDRMIKTKGLLHLLKKGCPFFIVLSCPPGKLCQPDKRAVSKQCVQCHKTGPLLPGQPR